MSLNNAVNLLVFLSVNHVVSGVITVLASADVHTVLLRLLKGDNSVAWAFCKGKAITRNGKKCSVVFTHKFVE